MSDPKKTGADLTPQGNAPSWVDEVLGSSRTTPAPEATATTPLSGPTDLKLPQPPAVPPPPHRSGDDWVSQATRGQAKTPQVPTGPTTAPRPTPSSADVLRDFVQPLTQAQGQTQVQTPPMPQVNTPANPAPVQAKAPQSSAWGEVPPAYSGENISQKKLVAGLLAILLGSFGVHKFYLGMNNPGLVMLGGNIGVWILAFLLGILTLGLGLFITLPLAGMISGAVGILGLVEGIIYLTKSDADFERDYVIGKKPWL